MNHLAPIVEAIGAIQIVAIAAAMSYRADRRSTL